MATIGVLPPPHPERLLHQFSAIVRQTGQRAHLRRDALRRLQDGVEVVLLEQLRTTELQHIGMHISSAERRLQPVRAGERLVRLSARDARRILPSSSNSIPQNASTALSSSRRALKASREPVYCTGFIARVMNITT
jgi:hypothetical protein